MLLAMAKRITSFFCTGNYLCAVRYEWYVYALEKRLTAFFSMLTLLALGTVLSDFWPTAVFLSSFYVLKRLAGGYHANTFFKCFSLSLAVMLLKIFFIVPLLQQFPPSYVVVVSGFSALVLLIIGPAGNPNLVLSDESKAYIYKWLRVAVGLHMLLIMVFLLSTQTAVYALNLFLVLFFVSVSVFIGKITYEKGGHLG